MLTREPRSFWGSRWAAFVLLTLSYMLIFTQRTGPGVISNKLQQQFHISSTLLGTMSSIQYLLYMVLQIPVGILADTLGPGRLLVIGMMLDGTGTILFSFAHHFGLVLVSRAIVGIGDALIWVNIVLLLGKRFAASSFGSVLGMVGTGGNLGALLTTIPLASWIAVAGWRMPFGMLGGALILVGLADVLAFVNPRRQHANAEDLLELQGFGMTQPVRLERVNVLAILSEVVKEPRSWVTFLCHCGSLGAYMGFTSIWAVPYFMSTYGISRVEASTFSFVAFVGAMAGGPIAGGISDRLQKRRIPYLVAQSLGLVAWLSFTLFHGHPPRFAAYLAMFSIGVVCGSSMLTFTVIRDQVSPERSGVASGFANTGGYLSAVVVPILYGVVIDLHQQGGNPLETSSVYAEAFLIPAFFSALGVIGSLFIRDKVKPTSA